MRFLAVAMMACLGMGFTVAAHAAPGSDDSPATASHTDSYLELDVNEDGRVSEEEALKDRRKKFEELDRDGDGAITLEEVRLMFSEAVPDDASERLRQRGIDDLSILFMDSLDKNENDRIELVEFERPARERFDQIDANSDGFATPGEITVFFSRIRL